MSRKIILFAALAAIFMSGCSGGDDGAPDPNAGKGPVKEGAGETKNTAMPNDSGP